MNAGGPWADPRLCFQEASAGGDREAAHDGPGDATACAAAGPASTSGEPGCSLSQRCDRPKSQRFACLGAQVGSFCCRPIIEGIQEQHKRGRPTATPPVSSRVWQSASLRLRGFGSPQIRCGGSRSTTPCSCSGCRKNTRRASTCPTSCVTCGCLGSSANDDAARAACPSNLSVPNASGIHLRCIPTTTPTRHQQKFNTAQLLCLPPIARAGLAPSLNPRSRHSSCVGA